MTDLTMVVPTYWGRAGSKLTLDEKIVFDHPTALDEDGTVARLLESLAIIEGADRLKIVIIPVPNDPRLASEVSRKVTEIISPFQTRYDIACFDTLAIDRVKEELEAAGVRKETLELANLDNYSAVRNMCSLAGILTGRKSTIFIDDDEVFVDSDFLLKIAENMGRETQGNKIEALAGFYLQPDSYLLNTENVPAWRAPYWNNAVAMNEAFDRFIGQEPRIKQTPFVFGGNMTLARSLLKSTPFDPKITRGEDIDFLLNLRIAGVAFFLDRELAIEHLPPASSRPAWKGIREDALRFLYERKKLMDHPSLEIDQFMPYPGRFLGADLEERIIETNTLLLKEYESQGDEEGIRECNANIAMAKDSPFRNVDTALWLKKLTGFWRELTFHAEGMVDKGSSALM